MRLAEWRQSKDWTQRDLADALGCKQSFISLLERRLGGQIPGRDWMLKIYRLTKGAVEPNDFYDLPPIDQLDLPIDDLPAAPLFDGATQCDAIHAISPAPLPQLQAPLIPDDSANDTLSGGTLTADKRQSGQILTDVSSSMPDAGSSDATDDAPVLRQGAR